MGFKNHTLKEHNMWNYVFFIFHISKKKMANQQAYIEDFTGSESEVMRQILEHEIAFFPVDRALSLEEVQSAEELRSIHIKERVSSIETSTDKLVMLQQGALIELQARLNMVASELRNLQILGLR